MRLRRLLGLLCACLALTGCSALLERDYATVEPHSSRFWESEAAGTLRAENYQDIVNDLLILIGQHTESATVRLYNYEDDVTVADALERATTEVQQETSMGAYAVEYITASSRSRTQAAAAGLLPPVDTAAFVPQRQGRCGSPF